LSPTTTLLSILIAFCVYNLGDISYYKTKKDDFPKLLVERDYESINFFDEEMHGDVELFLTIFK